MCGREGAGEGEGAQLIGAGGNSVIPPPTALCQRRQAAHSVRVVAFDAPGHVFGTTGLVGWAQFRGSVRGGRGGRAHNTAVQALAVAFADYDEADVPAARGRRGRRICSGQTTCHEHPMSVGSADKSGRWGAEMGPGTIPLSGPRASSGLEMRVRTHTKPHARACARAHAHPHHHHHYHPHPHPHTYSHTH